MGMQRLSYRFPLLLQLVKMLELNLDAPLHISREGIIIRVALSEAFGESVRERDFTCRKLTSSELSETSAEEIVAMYRFFDSLPVRWDRAPC